MSGHIAVAVLKFRIGNQEFTRKSLVSSFGALMVFEESEAPEGLEKLVNETMSIAVNDIILTGYFVKEVQANSAYYSVQFTQGSNGVKKLDGFLAENGAKMPPRRKFPRLDARKELKVAIPHYALLSNRDDGIFYSVVNFTIGGLLIESFGAGAEELAVGQKVEFELFLSDGDKIGGMFGEIVRTRETVSDEFLGEQCFQYGVRISDMEQTSLETYRKVIYDYCVALNKEVA